jgi:hypothetical protein
MKIDRRPKGSVIDLGLAVSGATLPPGQIRDTSEIASYCGCSRQMIHVIEKRALTKIRAALAASGIQSSDSIRRP